MRKIVGVFVLLLVMAALVYTIGCELEAWTLTFYRPTGIIPEVGVYQFSQQGCFEVRENSSGERYVVFAADCWNYQTIELHDGSFAYAWGEIGGTHCPTDSFGISGRFESPTKAAGMIKYAQSCQVVRTASFSATK